MFTWDTAKEKCRTLGMELARIDNREEHDWAYSVFRKSTPWIGVNDKEREGRYVNADGCAQRYLKME